MTEIPPSPTPPPLPTRPSGSAQPAADPSSSNLVSTQLLIDLVTNTLDPGYAAAAARRGGAPVRRWYDRPAVVLGCLLIGFTLVVAYVHTHRGAPEAAKVQDSLVARVRGAENDANRLDQQLQQVNTELTTVRDRALPPSGALAKQLDRDQLLAGEVAVHGSGLEVVLSEPKVSAASASAGRVGTTPIAATNILTDRDVQSVVNELWSAGAEAITVNNVRLTPTSAIRFAGQAVLVDFQPIASPYTVRALGNADGLATAFAASAVASRYQTLVSADGIGFSFVEHQNMTLPASAPASLRYARVPSPSPSSGSR
jgi:uncharacterized protein YlxW (UPF0749 family)